MLASLSGSYIPFARTKAEAKAAGDPRQSVEGRYGSFEGYRKQYAAACDDLARRGYLLREDAEDLTAGLEKYRDRFPGSDR
jgi:hypothetical protein